MVKEKAGVQSPSVWVSCVEMQNSKKEFEMNEHACSMEGVLWVSDWTAHLWIPDSLGLTDMGNCYLTYIMVFCSEALSPYLYTMLYSYGYVAANSCYVPLSLKHVI